MTPRSLKLVKYFWFYGHCLKYRFSWIWHRLCQGLTQVVPFIRSFFVLFTQNNALDRSDYGSNTYKMPFKARSCVKMNEKLKMTKIHKTATESELLNQISRYWCHSFPEKMFSHMQLIYVTISFAKYWKSTCIPLFLGPPVYFSSRNVSVLKTRWKAH